MLTLSFMTAALFALFALLSLSSAAPLHFRAQSKTAEWDTPTGTPPSEFAGSASLPVAALAKAALSGKTSLASYLVSSQSKSKSAIYGDWTSLPDVSAYHFTADMDVDCDGKNHQCKGNPDGQGQTTWGSLAAYQVPWIVMPDDFVSAHSKQLPGNNLAAVICGGKLFYGILGDTNGDAPLVTGEASWVLSRACFPSADLNGGAGHAQSDVTYIVFDKVFPKVDGTYITDFSALRTMGDDLVGKLAANLHLSGGGSSVGNTTIGYEEC